MVSFDSLQRGDLVELTWADITEDSTGDPSEAALVRRHSIGYFWERRIDGAIPVIITTTTIDEEIGSGSQGYCIYPEVCIVKVKAIKRKRRKKEELDGGDSKE